LQIEISVLASGSSGNAIYIKNNKHSILIDAGLSGKELEKRMAAVDLNPADLSALLVTHEHSDHIKGVGVLSRRYDLPVYANDKTWTGSEKRLGKIKEKNQQIFSGPFMIGELGFIPYATSHDANAPVGYICRCGNQKIGIATDTGFISEEAKKLLKGSDFLILESNHDLEMLMTGSYPWHLKKRIRSEQGHLSNDDAAALLPKLIKDNQPKVLLAHLSEENNNPQIAYITVKNDLEEAGFKIGEDLKLGWATQAKPTKVYKIG